ncbi:beta-glucosidase 31 isoform X1 [Amborella trichopoda]|uniref:beta-glucosidase 31 isoform X1 n=2 Tax=Amborella trichopoda TaxID=13333 RepID=UPI0009C0C405|nr:beta-glucosidase 31 isoform X1 [Amborella trichopoda]|eukprot:XP_011623510.2 beta-glucosidase 31 isoform X1 [Amborella trichopoda]
MRRVLVLLLLFLSSQTEATVPFTELKRQHFPPGFIFGAGSSAYQVEGAFAEDGRKPSIWDTFVHTGRMPGQVTGDVASDQYHKYKEDVKLMHEMGLDAYRFSISWSRLIPDGRGSVNPKGLEYYNNLINELLSHGIEAHVTLFHFDLPQSLEDEYNGWLSPKIIEDFTAYAEVCFREFGDRVSSWSTVNEPNILPLMSYDVGLFPPCRCSYSWVVHCSEGNSSVEPYVVAHNFLLAHAAVVRLYREKYQAKQKGKIGITLLAFWLVPLTNSSTNIDASKRVRDFHLGWFMDPLAKGDYPVTMKKIVKARLPKFTKTESKLLKGSFDFIGLNHYSTMGVEDYRFTLRTKRLDYITDVSAKLKVWRNIFVSPTEEDGSSFEYLSQGLPRLLKYIKQYYGNIALMIHENGLGLVDSPSTPLLMEAADDGIRVKYLEQYMGSLLSSIRNGSNVKGYFVWSFLDTFEFGFGYMARFGLYSVDFEDKHRRRYPTLSSKWYTNFLVKNNQQRELGHLILSHGQDLLFSLKSKFR